MRIDAPDLVELQTLSLRLLMPPIDAFGIGGSFGRGTADEWADIDFFIIVGDDIFWDFVKEFPSRISHPSRVVSQGIGRFMSDYGYRLAVMLEGGNKVEYWFNSPKTFTPLPLSACIKVIADDSGFLTRRLAEATAEFRLNRRSHVAAGVHDCLVEIHDLWKYAHRGDLLPMIWKLSTLRRPVLALHHMQTSSKVYAPSSAHSRLDSSVDQMLAERVKQSVPALSADSIAHTYRELRLLMVSAWTFHADTGVPSPEQRELEQNLSDELLVALKSVK